MFRVHSFSVLLAVLLAGSLASAQTDFIAFESGHVRPLALSPDGSQVFAVNTPDNRLEVFDVLGSGNLQHVDSIPVGMEPVAVAARTNTEVWVVNHLSDSVSIVDLSLTPPQVVRTLLVGDEPRDIVFAGSGGDRAFITAAHRGQNSPYTDPADPAEATTPGIGRADVWVFDATSLGSALGGTPVDVLTFFADTPRALAVGDGGNTVYVAAFKSGNQTTTINETSVPDGFDSAGPSGGAPGGVPGPDDNCLQTDPDPACEESVAAPETGLIVKFDGTNWKDAVGRNWDSLVNFDLPDHDVFSINANTLAGGSVVEYDNVGTVLFNMVVNPVTGMVYVTNIESPNHVRFEGPGVHGGSTVQGHLSESRITVLDPTGPSVDPQHLNQHIQYGDLHTDPGADHAAINAQIPHSLATPLQAVVSGDGNTIYMAAFGSGRIGVFDSADIEDGSFEANFDPTAESANYITTGGGPSGLALNEGDGRLYVLTRFDNSVAVIDLGSKATLETHALHNPEPQSVVDGRPFLYDATITSGNGEASCSSCHIFGDMDDLAWNLGDPDAGTSTNNQPSAVPLLPAATTFHPMKGPMTTQTLRGLATHGAMHWRGDRLDGFFGTDSCGLDPNVTAPCDEDFSFRNFIVAFEGLVGKEGTISGTQMQDFADFMLQVMLPPNPIRSLDNSLTTDQQDGADLFESFEQSGGASPPNSDVIATCQGCHNLAPGLGFFGSGGEQTFEGEPQNFKVAHMRNLYAKVGMFGLSSGGPHMGDQIRGFGFLHDGSVDTVDHFLEAPVFQLNDAQEADLEQYALAFPTDLAPIVGQQVTLTATSPAAVDTRINLMVARAATSFTSLMLGGSVTECDLIVKGSVGGVERGWVRDSGTTPANTMYRDDTNNLISDANLRLLASSEGPLTYTCAPPGSGTRMGINRDGDIVLDGLDNCPAVVNDDQTDTNMNGIGDACEPVAVDTDMDGVPDASDNCPADPNPLQENFDGDALGDACDPDDDNDGLADVVETNTGIFIGPGDTGTDPLNADSDGDGVSDGDEVAAGFDPTDPLSTPPVALVPAVSAWGQALLFALVLGTSALWLRRRAASAG